MGHACSINSTVFVKEEISIVLIGKSGSGKSAVGNSILLKEAFESKGSTSAVTERCKPGQNELIMKSTKYSLLVVDTPGFENTNMEEESVSEVISKCIDITSPGPHAILLVVPLINRFTKDEEEIIVQFLKLFGENLSKFMIIAFSHGDNITKTETITERLENLPQPLKELCQNRFVVFNNNVNVRRQMVAQLMSLITVVTDLKRENENKYYSKEMFKAAQEELQKQMRELQQKQEEMMKRELEKNAGHQSGNERGILERLGNGLYETGKGFVETGVHATGIPRLFNGISNWLGYK